MRVEYAAFGHRFNIRLWAVNDVFGHVKNVVKRIKDKDECAKKTKKS